MTRFLTELRRRNVFRVAAGYLVAGWIVMQVVATIGTAAGLPDWTDSLALIILVAGFPVVIFIAWAFELTPEGLKKTEDVEAPSGFKPLGPSDYVLIAAVLVVLGIGGAQLVRGPGGDAGDGTPDMADAVPVPDSPDVSDSSIAVLPFADLSPAGDQQYFSDGIAEEILNVLVRIDGLDVASRTSAFQYRGEDYSIPEIADGLSVRHILEGSVRRDGETVRITAQLIDARDDRHLWSETYDRPLTAGAIFAVQDEIATAIVEALRAFLDETAPAPVIAVEAVTDDVDAYTLYLEARALYLGRRDLDRVMDLLDQAIARDPGFAQAYAIRAGATHLLPDYSETARSREDLNAEARRFAGDALDIDPENATAIAVLANTRAQESRLLGTWADYSDIIAQYTRALDIDPHDGSARNWRGLTYFNMGYLELALADFQACLEQEPRYAPCAENHYDTLYALGRTGEALAAYQESLFAGLVTGEWSNFGMLAHFRKDIAFAHALNQSSVLQRYPRIGEIYDAYLNLDEDHSDLGEDAWRYAASIGNDTNPLVPVLLLAIDPAATNAYPFTQWQPELRAWRQSGSFKNGMRERGILDYWREHGFPLQCRPVGEDDFECE
ncbi:hypothetical protein HXX25_00500 [Hyphobacterium sp. CCMP332]|uniref:tetratricopeptide repeat protein n=1 Tax=Hyphobacterium sp. CCMP332 TaxID=2749086 RepID=UPI0016504D27|nr:hypothetical protein [Hyphobacterium sp. CCMP332]QNL17945.1 hypothetical protein HXX25_00500 [Hyphobacterium sp. CCMP332]